MSYYAYMSNEASNFFMTLAGRQVEFRKAHVGQILMLQRTAMRSVASAEDDGKDDSARVEAVSAGIVKVLDFIDKLIVKDEDRQFVEDKMLDGEITWDQLARALAGGEAPDDTADDESPKPKKNAAKRSPKAAPAAKTVAARGRAKR